MAYQFQLLSETFAALAPAGAALFITWRLHGSLPADRSPAGGACPSVDDAVENMGMLEEFLLRLIGACQACYRPSIRWDFAESAPVLLPDIVQRADIGWLKLETTCA